MPTQHEIPIVVVPESIVRSLCDGCFGYQLWVIRRWLVSMRTFLNYTSRALHRVILAVLVFLISSLELCGQKLAATIDPLSVQLRRLFGFEKSTNRYWRLKKEGQVHGEDRYHGGETRKLDRIW